MQHIMLSFFKAFEEEKVFEYFLENSIVVQIINRDIMKEDKKKDQILNVAERLFSASGYEATTIRDIAEVAEVNISLINYYFGGKYRLLQHIVGGICDTIKGFLLPFLEKSEAGYHERLQFINGTLSFLQGNRARLLAQILLFSPGLDSDGFVLGIRRMHYRVFCRLQCANGVSRQTIRLGYYSLLGIAMDMKTAGKATNSSRDILAQNVLHILKA
jgi:AcrR family transcriptional regulator